MDELIVSKQYYEFVNKISDDEFISKKILGKFYTNFYVSDILAKQIIRTFDINEQQKEIKIIDPFCGDGRLIISLLREMISLKKNDGVKIYISIWDIESSGVQIAEKNIYSFCKEKNLLFEIDSKVTDSFLEYRKMMGKYDICITNPPWGLIKPQKLMSDINGDDYKKYLENYDDYMKKEFLNSQPSSKFGKWGTNLARCGVEVAYSLIKCYGVCGVVSPASFLNDQVSKDLRRCLFENYKVLNISYFPAELRLYEGADISSVTITFIKEDSTKEVNLEIYNSKEECFSQNINKNLFEYIKNNNYILPLKNGIDSLYVMIELEKNKTVLEYCDNHNLVFIRELDETKVNEKLLNQGKIKFIKGKYIDRYSKEDSELYFNDELYNFPKSVFKDKLVWRDVSRDSQRRRVKATILPPNYICGNSLGVIYNFDNSLKYLKMLLAIFNSMIFEYQVKNLMVSNHVSVGIIKKLRIPDFEINDKILNLVEEALSGKINELEIEIEVAKLYHLSIENYEKIIKSFNLNEADYEFLIETYKKEIEKERTTNKMIFNHYASTLSELDLQIIKYVPSGGNWKDIPETVPSKRINQIRESYKAGKGSRSTYYGRLKSDMPSYTINTYFNRPGNGCHIHYNQNRTLSQREAARFQTFPDNFEFIGSLGAINNQIGNAVPPLLAYQIAKSLPFKGQFVDLFCGAGGLALGFIWAGWKPIVGNDIDKYAIKTHEKNIFSEVILGDINDSEIHSIIVSKALQAKKENPKMPLFILGGPPCQGFSTANTRRGADDQRNWLFKSYVNIMKDIKPDGFVFENVKGILNLEKGDFFKMIQAELKSCVENIKINKINSANYGIPQRRERVIVLGGSEKVINDFELDEISCVPKDGHLMLVPKVIGAEEAIGDLPELVPGQDGSKMEYKHPPINEFQKFSRGQLSADDYLSFYKKKPID